MQICWDVQTSSPRCPLKVNRVTLTLRRSFLVLAYKQTFQDSVRISQKCPGRDIACRFRARATDVVFSYPRRRSRRIQELSKPSKHDRRHLTGLSKSKAPDCSEARPYRRAGYIRPRHHQFLYRQDNRCCPLSSAFRPSRGEPLIFPRRKTGVRHSLPCQQRI